MSGFANCSKPSSELNVSEPNDDTGRFFPVSARFFMWHRFSSRSASRRRHCNASSTPFYRMSFCRMSFGQMSLLKNAKTEVLINLENFVEFFFARSFFSLKGISKL